MNSNFLYPPFRHWKDDFNTIWIYSDPHFGDFDCYFRRGFNVVNKFDIHMCDTFQISNINQSVGKNDVIIFLGDIGDIECVKRIKGYKVLIMGNHDKGSTSYYAAFNEVYSGPLIIGPKILLSHEPINVPYLVNLHGHVHTLQFNDGKDFNFCAEAIGYNPVSLIRMIKDGAFSKIDDIHRQTIDYATERKNKEK